jgi:hypothetical protein
MGFGRNVVVSFVALGCSSASVRSEVPDGHVPQEVRSTLIVHCDLQDTKVDSEWEQWRNQTFGTSLDMAYSGVEQSCLDKLTGPRLAEANRMLRRGLEACDAVAPRALKRLNQRAAVPDLKAALVGATGSFRLAVIVALHALDVDGHYGSELVRMFGDPNEYVRTSAAIAAETFPRAEVTPALFQAVRRDCYLVRYHAANSLLALGDVYPRELDEHGEIFRNLMEPDLGSRGAERKPKPDELSRYDRAARMLASLIEARARAGRCSPMVPLKNTHVSFERVNTNVLAVAIEQAESSCEKELAFVVFIESLAGPGRWDIAGASAHINPFSFDVSLPASKLKLTYDRIKRILMVGDLRLEAPATTVAVISVGRGAKSTLRYGGAERLTFRRNEADLRNARARSLYDRAREQVRDLLDRSTPLKSIITYEPAPP